MTEHEAAKPKRPRDIEFDDAPSQESIRGMSPRTIRRNPSSDQKRVRREMQRKIAGEETELSRLLVEAAAVDNPFDLDDEGLPVGSPSAAPSNEKTAADINNAGDKECQSCGHQGAPVLGDTGPACRNCNSYSLKNIQEARTAAKATCPNCGVHLLWGECPNCGYEAPADKKTTAAKTAINDAEMSQASSERAQDDPNHACPHCGLGPHDEHGYCENCGTHIDDDEPEKGDPQDDYYSQGGGHEDNYGDPYGKMDAYHDFKNSSLQAQATHFDTSADRLNPGDQIRTPTGQTVKVLRMRNHETSPGHVYMDTDQGTSVVRRKAPVSIVPFNSQQQEMPGYGTPGGNTNQLPLDQGNVGPSKRSPAGTNTADPGASCPVCGGKGTLHRQGQSYVCSKCGYRENIGAAGPGKGFDFNDMPQRLMGTSALDSAIARRARQVLDSTEENQ